MYFEDSFQENFSPYSTIISDGLNKFEDQYSSNIDESFKSEHATLEYKSIFANGPIYRPFYNQKSKLNENQSDFEVLKKTEDKKVTNEPNFDGEKFKTDLEEAIAPGESKSSLKFKYTSVYKLTNDQYQSILNFYDQNKSSNNLLSTKLLKELLNGQIESRKDKLMASESDVDRALKLIDSDSNGFINLNEFVDLLSLFFANKLNLAERIKSVLDNKSFSRLKPFTITANDATNYFEFLADFFAKQESNEPKLLNFCNITKAYLMEPYFSQTVSNEFFADTVAAYLHESLFLL